MNNLCPADLLRLGDRKTKGGREVDLRRRNRKVSDVQRSAQKPPVGGGQYLQSPSPVNRIYVHWTPHMLASLGWETNHFHLLCHLQWVGSVPPTEYCCSVGGNVNLISCVCKGQGCVWGVVAVCTLVAISLVQDTDRNDNVRRVLF